MNRPRYLLIGTALMVAFTVSAQQAATGSGSVAKDEHVQPTSSGDVPIIGQQLKVLTEKLDLTDDQQAKMKPILRELHDAVQKVVQDKSLSREERMGKARPHFYKADKQMREILSEDQKKKLDQYEQEPHPEMHGELDAETSAPGQAPRN